MRIVAALAFLCLMVGCKPAMETKLNFSDVNTIDEILFEAKSSQQYTVLMVTNKTCDVCFYYKRTLTHMVKTKPDLFPVNATVTSVDARMDGNMWVNQIVREYAFPLFLIIDPSGNVRGVLKGGSAKDLVNVMSKIAAGSMYFSESKRPFLNIGKDTSQQLSTASKVAFVNDLFHVLSDFRTHGKVDSNENDRLVKSIQQQPYFLNKYLLSKSLYSSGLTDSAKAISNSIMKENFGELDAMLYQPYMTEVRFMADNSFDTTRQPLLVTAQTDMNFGNDVVNARKKLEVPVKNAGTEPLKIENVRVSCECLKVDWPKEPIAAGATKNIIVEYELKRTGPFSQHLFVFSNSPTLPLLININGNVTLH
ncbi:uncharacterized protein DUF1573 [Chitinophaga skermanii]|uniref:Uncharacterized protein DUF1573 n=1 Tax=Chitinophaga skermanii TaxID=331697 RepID=A0A327R4N5_9BACT|nr:DUF1573 domain-containing protein [Chitinophaga skermanii]RAJ11175.1 uncharacterized protein DUF1573 [Chitinophaga skermanii]